MAAPAFRAAGANAAAGTTTLAVPYPAGVAANDLLLIHFTVESGATVTTPSGWTLLFGPVSMTGFTGFGYVFWRVAGGSEPASVTITISVAKYKIGRMTAWTGCNTTTPIDVSATATLPTSGTSGSCPSVTTTGPDRQLLHLYWDWTGTGGITPNAADTERYDTYDTNIFIVEELADRTQAAAGATGTSAATFAAATLGGLAATVALAPGAAAAPVADFTGTPTSGTASLSVTFTDTSTNTPTSWAWTFGDGGTSTSQNPSHSYTTSGVYTVALVATNSAGSNTKTRTAYITVGETISYAAGGGVFIY